MRINQFTLVFVIIVMPVITALHIRLNMLHELVIEKNEIDLKLAKALDEAVMSITEDICGDSVFDKRKAADNFFSAYSMSFAAESGSEQQELYMYVPVVAVIDKDYYEISYCTAQDIDGKTYICRNWSERIETGYESEEFYESFEETFNYYINNHNIIAKEYGIKHKYDTRLEDTKIFEKSITCPSLIVWFEGYPYGILGRTYEKAFISGAEIKKADEIFITNSEGEILYHNGSCGISKTEAFFSAVDRITCEKYGAVMCDKCFDY